MKQQMKIMITKKGDKNDGIWISLPISQNHFEKLTRDVDFDEIEITNNIGGNAAPLTFLCYNGKK